MGLYLLNARLKNEIGMNFGNQFLPLLTSPCQHFKGGQTRTKNQPKEQVFGTDIPRTSEGHSPEYSSPNCITKSWKNKHMDEDIQDPKARTSTTLRAFQKLGEKNFGMNFRSLPRRPGFRQGGFPIWTPICPFDSSGFSRLFGDFPDLSFSSFSAYYKHLQGTVPKGSGPFPKKSGKPPGLEPPLPQFSFLSALWSGGQGR